MNNFPLTWPDGVPRHKGVREAGLFKSSLNAALENATKSLKAFGRDSGLEVTNFVFSSNVGGLGSGTPADPGIALWFTWDGAQRCIPVDRYSKPEANLQAIHHILEADRTKLRHGSLLIVRAAYKGLAAALPPPGRRTPRAILGIKPEAVISKDMIEAAYREAAKSAHPDKPGGSNERMAELNGARTQALAEVA